MARIYLHDDQRLKLRNPGLRFILSFIVLIAVGTPLLMLPVATEDGREPAGFIDALFTATSAVCVTGLITLDTPAQFSPFGETVIACLIQLGALSVVIFGTTLALLVHQRLSLRSQISLTSALSDMPYARMKRLVLFIIIVTIAFELLGALVMYPGWQAPDGGALTTARRAGLSLFHAISAFCNAGFALQSDSLESYRYTYITHGVIAPLLVIGGLGFPALINIAHTLRWQVRRAWARLRGRAINRPANLAATRLSLHTKIILTTTAILYLGGVITIAAGQFMPYFQDAFGVGYAAHTIDAPLTAGTCGHIIADASFTSLTSRTAGFNSMPMDEMEPGGLFVVMLLMFVGGSPGGTAGGLKTMTVAVLCLAVFATWRQRKEAEAFGRTISDAFVRKAAALAVAYIALIAGGTLLLNFSEPQRFERVLFEAVSAVTTTGLSTGITSSLTPFGKLVIIALMFLGRVGPLAMVGALLFRGVAKPRYRYAHEDVYLG